MKCQRNQKTVGHRSKKAPVVASRHPALRFGSGLGRQATGVILVQLGLLLAAPLQGEEANLVEKGKEAFQVWNCATCHAIDRDDVSVKTGPSLYNLFQNPPRDREVLVPATGSKATIKADKDYFLNSVRNPAAQLACAEKGQTKGEAYPPIMPQFTAEVITDANLESLWHYLRFSAESGKNGPAVVMGQVAKEAVTKDFENPAAVLVAKRPRIFRAPLDHSSGRAIHVGLPNGMNYTFDPRRLSLRGVWSGGFLNLKKEQTGRSTPGSEHGFGASDILDSTPALVPLTTAGTPIDFEFKEPDVNDDAAATRYLEKGGDFLKELAAWDAGFLGYQVGPKGEPEFRFRIGKNKLSENISFTEDGSLVIEISGKLATPQSFQIQQPELGEVKVEGGTLKDGRWTLPVGEGKSYRLQAKVGKGLVARSPLPVAESLAPQPVVTEPSEADLPAGYRIENWMPPKDLFGRDQLFEPTGIAVAKDGTIVVGTRTAGVWRLKNKSWQLFAEGTYECLGLVIEDDHGDRIVIAQKPELTRLRDTNGDGLADSFETVCDSFGFHGNYHEYTHGPVRDAEGNLYFSLNLCHSKNAQASYRAGGQFMGSMGGFRGWSCRVTPAGKFEPFASGVRSPAGLGIDPKGRLLYTENQGEYVGSSKISYLVKGEFYGHPSGLVSLPGMTPTSPEIAFDKWQSKTHQAALWFPHNKLANSPGSPAWDLSKGKFGPFGGQMFIGDQTLSTLVRVASERVGETDQGTMILFARKLASGVMRPCFLPDGSLLLGQTGRGWRANGGKEASLQRIIADPSVTAADLKSIETTKNGFTLHFTTPLAAAVTPEGLLPKIQIDSWTYTDAVTYGSGENEKRKNAIASLSISSDRKSASLVLPEFATSASMLHRIHRLTVDDAAALFAPAVARPQLEAYQTVHAIPQ
jgi:hypothetical protein